jgi:hypothetical protein
VPDKEESRAQKAVLRAPDGLSARSRRIWKAVNTDWDLLEHEQATLEEALRALDRSAEARKAVDRDGPLIRDRYAQPRAHPGLVIERDHRNLYLRAMRELALDPREVEARPPP